MYQPKTAQPLPFSMDRATSLVFLIVLGQLADLLTFVLVIGTGVPGTEVGPLGSVLRSMGPGAVVVVKLLAIVVLGTGACYLRHRPKLLAVLAFVGFFGAFLNTASFLTA